MVKNYLSMGDRMYALWGSDKEEFHMKSALLDYIRNKVGLKEDKILWSGYAEFDNFKKSDELEGILASCVSPENTSFDSSERVKHSIGRSGKDYIPLIEKKDFRVVDAVVYPNEDEIRRLLQSRNKLLEIVPFGGGTTVTGGVSPSGNKKYSVSVDLEKLKALSVDMTNHILEAGTGLKGPEIEAELSKHGLTLGNFPESFFYSTLGGWIATNAAGQESNRYGKIKDMIISLRMESPTGSYQDHVVPGESAFFRLSDIAVGSEGAYGIVTKAWLKVHNKPERLFYNSYIFKSFGDGLAALRERLSNDKIPMISRLSDEEETELSFMGIEDNFITNLFKRYVSFRTHGIPGALLIAVSEKKEEIKFEGGASLGSVPPKFWYRERYSRPYMYNELLKRGIIAETIETSAKWDGLDRIHKTTKKRFDEILEELKLNGLIMCHSSHQYVTGSALYFTFLFYSRDNREKALERIRDGIMENILSEGGSISHHHGIGTAQSKYVKSYKGKMYEVAQGIKSQFDPDDTLVPGIMPPR